MAFFLFYNLISDWWEREWNVLRAAANYWSDKNHVKTKNKPFNSSFTMLCSCLLSIFQQSNQILVPIFKKTKNMILFLRWSLQCLGISTPVLLHLSQQLPCQVTFQATSQTLWYGWETKYYIFDELLFKGASFFLGSNMIQAFNYCSTVMHHTNLKFNQMFSSKYAKHYNVNKL